MSPDPFVALLALLNTKITAQSEVIVQLTEDDRASQRRTEDLQYDNHSLRSQVERLTSQMRSFESYKVRCEQLECEVRELRYGALSVPVYERLNNYMKAEGCKQLADGNKIAAIKGVREVTGWGLKESKDYVESHKTPVVPPPAQTIGELIKSKLGPVPTNGH